MIRSENQIRRMIGSVPLKYVHSYACDSVLFSLEWSLLTVLMVKLEALVNLSVTELMQRGWVERLSVDGHI